MRNSLQVRTTFLSTRLLCKTLSGFLVNKETLETESKTQPEVLVHTSCYRFLFSVQMSLTCFLLLSKHFRRYISMILELEAVYQK